MSEANEQRDKDFGSRHCSSFLPGSGVLLVGWVAYCESLENVEQSIGGNPIKIFKALRLQRPGNGTVLRVYKKLLRYNIDSWSKLKSMQTADFREWKNYGAITHRTLVDIAKEHGVKVASY